MAIMIPDTAPPANVPGARTERIVWEALRDSLPDDMFVYSRLPYLEPARAAEGECDFVVIHRELGLLVVECKGWGVRRRGDGRWIRVDPSGAETELDESPFEQVRRHTKDLVRVLEARLRPVLPDRRTLPLIYGHAVWLPLVHRRDVGLPLDAAPETVLDARDLADPERAVRGLFRFWRADRRPPAPFTESEFRRFRRDVLFPRVHLAPSLGARIELDRRQMLRLTEQQMAVVAAVLANRRVRVTGGAGTGKTVLAVEAARRLAASGRRVLLLCFNRALGDHLRSRVAGLPEDERIDATHFHRLCHLAYEALGQVMTVPAAPADAATFWTVEAPYALFQAVDEGRLARWDAILVDEGQDIAKDWWTVIESALVPGGHLAVFSDSAQDIFARGDAMPDTVAHFPLTVSFRNTRAIADVVRRLGGVELAPHPDCPEGEPPVVYPQPDRVALHLALAALVADLRSRSVLLEQIVVLTPHSPKNSSLSGLERLGDIDLTDDPFGARDALLHTTIAKFKGLEADVVILLDIDPSDPRCGRLSRYVAASRARHALYVFESGGSPWI